MADEEHGDPIGNAAIKHNRYMRSLWEQMLVDHGKQALIPTAGSLIPNAAVNIAPANTTLRAFPRTAKHVKGSPCSEGVASCHHHHGVFCHLEIGSCDLALKAIKASYTAGGKWSGAPQGLNESHEACMRQPYAGNVKSMCDPHYVLYIEQLPTKEAREATTAIRRL